MAQGGGEMKINSKWSFIMCGVNVIIALLGALTHSLPLAIMGGVFTFWNWKCGEINRGIEDETIREESRSNTNTETKE